MEWPKCDYIDTASKIICQNGILFSCGKSLNEDCPSCHGTGEKAVLTEGEAIRYLVENIPCRIYEKPGHYGFEPVCWGMDFRESKYRVGYYKDIWPEGEDLFVLGKSENLIEALNLAARVVKERSIG